jgi:general secretion pathway protein E
LVLSTLHTNTAVGAISRLSDMGVEPFLLASSLSAVIAQRLVRKLCPHCKEAYEPDEAGKEHVRHLVDVADVVESGEIQFYKAVGCDQCNYQGYKGRTGIYEYIEVDEQIRRCIHDGSSEQAIIEHAREKYPSIRDDGFHRVLRGETTFEEVLRVTTV